MKVLHIVGFYPEIGGPFTVTKDLLIKLVERGVFVKVISPIPKGYDRNKLLFIKDLPFEVIYVEEQLPRNIWPSFSLKFFELIKTESKKNDLIHVAMPFDFYNIPVFFSFRKYILTLHGVFKKEAYEFHRHKFLKKNIYMKLIGIKLFRRASFIHCLSEEERIDFIHYFPCFSEKIILIPNGINIDSFRSANVSRSLSDGVKKILFLGRINWKKGLDILIPAFARLIKDGVNLRLVIAGKDDGDGYEIFVREIVKSYNVQSKVDFVGFVEGEQKLNLLKSCDVFVLPSYSEGLPTAVIEAMAAGIPVITTNKTGISREIEKRDCGIIVEPEESSLYNGLVRYLKMSSEDLLSMVEKARIYVYNTFDINNVVDEYIKMYDLALKY